ncbi:MAG: putative membrane protein YfcA [Verrucomicrobiales bacterium]|jgi:uncharacterized membrane protein YfcA
MTTTEIVIVALMTALAALVKSTTGMGFPLVLLPVLALFMDVADAVVIVVPVNLSLNCWLVLTTRHERHNVPTLARFTFPSLAGTVLGALLLPILPETLMRGFLIGIIVLFLATHLAGRSPELSEARAAQLSPVVGGLAGVFQGAANVAGPIVTPWFLSQGLRRDALVYALAAFFSLTGIIQIAVFVIRGGLSMRLFGFGIALIPVAFLAVPVGVRIRKRISVEGFQQLVLVLLAGSAISLLVRIL